MDFSEKLSQLRKYCWYQLTAQSIPAGRQECQLCLPSSTNVAYANLVVQELAKDKLSCTIFLPRINFNWKSDYSIRPPWMWSLFIKYKQILYQQTFHLLVWVIRKDGVVFLHSALIWNACTWRARGKVSYPVKTKSFLEQRSSVQGFKILITSGFIFWLFLEV